MLNPSHVQVYLCPSYFFTRSFFTSATSRPVISAISASRPPQGVPKTSAGSVAHLAGTRFEARKTEGLSKTWDAAEVCYSPSVPKDNSAHSRDALGSDEILKRLKAFLSSALIPLYTS